MNLDYYTTVDPAYLCQLAAPDRSLALAAVSPGPAGEAVCVWSYGCSDGRHVILPNGVGVPQARADSSYPVVITLHRGADAYQTFEITHDLAWADYQPLPGGRLLGVGGRAALTPDGPEHNGSIWITYGDEAYGGNLGWGLQGGAGGFIESPAMKGLVKWSSGFEAQWTPAPSVFEVTALTVCGEGAIAACCGQGEVLTPDGDSFVSRVETPQAIISDGDRYVIVGKAAYGHLTVILGHNEAGKFVWQADGPFPRAPRRPHEGLTIAGHDQTINIWAGRRWFQTTLEQHYAGIQRR
ncbi:MAG: hypothetical protein LBI84_03270 [Propionibacteriaceae bacterium]|jgi:hypothetical protein|nr:hypothetical protein [Propionibacteriaceae bacterium]